jgi:hypothetical protein
MTKEWDSNLKTDIQKFLNSLRDETNKNHYFPVSKGKTYSGQKLSLGFSCYAIKCFYMLDLWDEFDHSEKKEWIDYINSFQANIKNLPDNSYVDPVIFAFYTSFLRKISLKNNLKLIMNKFLNLNKRTYRDLYTDSIRAETKQAIATLSEVGFSNKKKYLDFPSSEKNIIKYLDSLDWSKPWNAGAQYAAICVFNATQLKKNVASTNFEVLYTYLDNVLNTDSGLYHSNTEIKLNEKINGTMKVITGLDWINRPIHLPNEIIDFCLSIEPESDGCDIVDLVYVLYKSCKQTNYKVKEVQTYFEEIKKTISLNFYKSSGGFSYGKKKSQTSYYGLKISKGYDFPDLHGTTLLLWALTMIYDLNGSSSYNILKP